MHNWELAADALISAFANTALFHFMYLSPKSLTHLISLVAILSYFMQTLRDIAQCNSYLQPDFFILKE
jgi:hypothetical protein